MARKTDEEKLQELNKKMEQLQNQKKALLARQKIEGRKARTKRLIEVGAEVEAALGFSLDTPEVRKALGDFLRDQERRGKFVSKWIDAAVPEQKNVTPAAGETGSKEGK